MRLPHVSSGSSASSPTCSRCKRRSSRTRNSPPTRSRDYGYVATFSGQSAYNGVAILSREPPSAVSYDIGGGYVDEQKRVLGATFGALRFWSLYVPNGQSVDSDKYRYKLEWLAALRVLLADELARHPALLLVGDFNIAPDDRDVHNPAAWAGKIMCTPAERAALAATLRARVCAIRSGCSRSPKRSSAGGITAPARFAATRACESTSFSPRKR